MKTHIFAKISPQKSPTTQLLNRISSMRGRIPGYADPYLDEPRDHLSQPPADVEHRPLDVSLP